MQFSTKAVIRKIAPDAVMTVDGPLVELMDLKRRQSI